MLLRVRLFSIMILSLLVLSYLQNIPSVEARSYLFETDSSISIIADTNDFGIVSIEGEPVSIDIIIVYEYGRFARPEGFPLPNNRIPTKINLTLESLPNWCTVELDQDYFEVPIETFILQKNKTVNLTAKITASITSKKAPAFEEGLILLNVTAEKNGNVISSNAELEITLKPDFNQEILISQSNKTIELSSGQEKNFSLIIKNNGNIDIIPEISYNITDSEYFEVIIPESSIINVDEEKTILINIIAKKSNESLNVTEKMSFNISYHASGYKNVKGTNQVVLIDVTVINEVNSEISIELATIILVIALIILIVPLLILLYIYMKKKH